MTTLGMTHSACADCRRIVPAKVAVRDGGVWFDAFCPEHGASSRFVRSDAADYVRSLRFVKPAWTPRRFGGDAAAACPDGCGLCDRHEQHLCMPIIEITSRCDLACPACLVDAGRDGRDMTLDEFRGILDRLIAAEGQIDLLNLSGGEPTIHPRFLAMADEALSRPQVVRVSVSTNGLKLLADGPLRAALADRRVVVSLQFDGTDDRAYRVLRGRPMARDKLRLLDLLAEADAPASLTMTAAGGVNDDQFAPAIELLFSRPNLLSLMVQPIALAGRGAGLAGRVGRLTIPDVVRGLADAGGGRVRADDFAPLPCSHPLCFSLAYYLVLGAGRTVSLNQLLGAERVMGTVANRTVFGLDAAEQEQLRDMVYELWSGPVAAAPDGEAIMAALRAILDESAGPRGCGCFDPRAAFAAAERRIKSIFIHAFQDADTFDLARVRRCCNGYPQPDGRLLPACVNNVLKRKGVAR